MYLTSSTFLGIHLSSVNMLLLLSLNNTKLNSIYLLFLCCMPGHFFWSQLNFSEELSLSEPSFFDFSLTQQPHWLPSRISQRSYMMPGMTFLLLVWELAIYLLTCDSCSSSLSELLILILFLLCHKSLLFTLYACKL